MNIQLAIRGHQITLTLKRGSRVIDSLNWQENRDLTEKLLPNLDLLLKKNGVRLTQIKNFRLSRSSNSPLKAKTRSISTSTERIAKAVLKTLKLASSGLVLFLILVPFSQLYAATSSSKPASTSTTDADKAKLIEKKKQELDQARKRAGELQNRTDALTDTATKLSNALERLNSDIAKTEAAIEQAEQAVQATQKEIDLKIEKINLEEADLSKKRASLAEYLSLLNYIDQKSALEIILSAKDFSDYWQQSAQLLQASEAIKQLYDEIKTRKALLMEEKAKLEDTQAEQEALRAMQDQQKYFLEVAKKEKDQLLTETKNQTAHYQDLLSGERTSISRLSAELTDLQSLGTALDFKEVLKAARFAADKTGVRVAFLLGILRIESNMGSNVGGGYYKQDMHPAQRDYFETICKRLNYDPDKQPVSKKPCYRDKKGNCTGWGGAMGPAQFMPSTWKGYEAKVAEVAGVKTADPWNLRHALLAMALKVAKVEGVTSQKESAERKAANIYLAGGNWENFTWYGDRVLGYAEAFAEKIKDEKL